MSTGQPLTDQDRIPWLLNIHGHIKCELMMGHSGIVMCSALKRYYREILVHGEAILTDPSVTVVDSDHQLSNLQTPLRNPYIRQGNVNDKEPELTEEAVDRTIDSKQLSEEKPEADSNADKTIESKQFSEENPIVGQTKAQTVGCKHFSEEKPIVGEIADKTVDSKQVSEEMPISRINSDKAFGSKQFTEENQIDGEITDAKIDFKQFSEEKPISVENSDKTIDSKQLYEEKPTAKSDCAFKDNSDDIIFVHLSGAFAVMERRLASRKGHFMPGSLLQSQLDTLEPPDQDENCVTVEVDSSIDDIVDLIIEKLRLKLGKFS